METSNTRANVSKKDKLVQYASAAVAGVATMGVTLPLLLSDGVMSVISNLATVNQGIAGMLVAGTVSGLTSLAVAKLAQVGVNKLQKNEKNKIQREKGELDIEQNTQMLDRNKDMIRGSVEKGTLSETLKTQVFEPNDIAKKRELFNKNYKQVDSLFKDDDNVI